MRPRSGTRRWLSRSETGRPAKPDGPREHGPRAGSAQSGEAWSKQRGRHKRRRRKSSNQHEGEEGRSQRRRSCSEVGVILHWAERTHLTRGSWGSLCWCVGRCLAWPLRRALRLHPAEQECVTPASSRLQLGTSARPGQGGSPRLWGRADPQGRRGGASS